MSSTVLGAGNTAVKDKHIIDPQDNMILVFSNHNMLTIKHVSFCHMIMK